MKKYLVVGNWKMNPASLKEALFLAGEIDVRTKNTTVAICPPFLYIESIKNKIKNIKIGAQNCFWENKGAFTGEISPLMLKNLGVEFVIIGHSERRKNLKETDKIVEDKIKKTLQIGLIPILCVGGAKKQKAKNLTFKVLRKQLAPLIEIKKGFLIVAYEPIWAIGRGETEDPLEIKKVVSFIREFLKASGKIKENYVRIIYGGSIDSKNIKKVIESSKAEGVLVGGASLNSKEFVKIIKIIEDLK